MPNTLPISSLIRTNTTIRDLFVYLYELNPLEADLLFILIKTKKKGLTLDELSKLSNRKKSTVFRSMQHLSYLKLCNREMETRTEGGYYYLYSAIDIESLKKETENRVKQLEASIHSLLKSFESHVQRTISTFYQESK